MILRECQFLKFNFFLRIAVFGVLLLMIACGQSKEKHLAKGEELLQKRKFQEAVMEFRAAADVDSNSAAAHWGLARAYENLEQFNDALEEVRKTTDLAPDNLDAKTKLGNYQLLFKPPMIAETEQLLGDIFKRNPKFIEAHILKASLLSVQNKPESEVVAALNEAIATDPNRTESYISLARYFMKLEKGADAEAAIKKGISVRPEAALGYVEFGRFLTFAGRDDEAEAQYKKATEVEPANYEARETIAEYYVARRQFDKAEAAYKELVRVQENAPEARLELAGFYVQAGRGDDAVAVLAQIIQETPEYVRARYRLGEIYLDRHDAAKVTEQIDALLKINDRDAQALLLRARLSVQNNKVEDAVKDLEDILKKLPSHRDALYLMSEARIALGQTEQARAFIGDLEKYHPNYLKSKLLRVQVEFADGRADTALRLSTELYSTTKGIVADSASMSREIAEIRYRALSSRGLANLQLGKLDEAKTDLTEALASAPKSASAMVNLGRVLTAQKDFAGAQKMFADALAVDAANFDALSATIGVLQRQKQFAPAHAKIDEFLARSGDRRDVQAALHYLKADTFIAEKNTTAAEAELQKAMTADEGYLPAYSTYASLLVARNESDAALVQFRKAADQKPSPAMLTMIGMLEEARGNNAEAEKAYRKALDISPDTPIAANNLAWIIADGGQGNLDEALRLAQSAANRGGNVAGYFDTLGLVYFKKGLYLPAVEQFRKAVAFDEGETKRTGAKPNAAYRFRLATALASAGDKESARREVQASLADEQSLSAKEAQEAKNLLAGL